jgi:FkbM family methyltransferase
LVPECQIVLAVCNLYGDLKSISQLIGPNIQISSPVEIFQMFSDLGIDSHFYWLSTDFDLFSKSRLELQSFKEILGDDESRELFDGILNYRKNGQITDLPSPRPLREQYLAKDYSTPPKDLRIIDLGACQGENLEAFLNAGHLFIDGFLFEPDTRNFKLLKDHLKSLNLTSLECYPLGAWSETSTLKFQASGNPAAALSGVGDISVNVVALDDFIPENYSPNFVKMDIEGAEYRVLPDLIGLGSKVAYLTVEFHETGVFRKTFEDIVRKIQKSH